MPTPLIIPRPEGLYCPPGGFYVDPMRPVASAVITHAHSDHARTGHQEYFTSRSGAPLLRERIKSGRLTALDWGVRQKFGSVWVSLHPAGHILGSAQVRIESGSDVWVVTGDYKRDADASCEPFETVKCDTLISEATFALPLYQWPPLSEVVDEILDWWNACREEGRVALLNGYSLGKAQRILAELKKRVPDEWAFVSPPVENMNTHYRAQGYDLLETRPLTDAAGIKDFVGRLVLAPPGALGSPSLRKLGKPSTAFASGWMQLRSRRGSAAQERGFVLSDHADWPSLLRTIRESGAKNVLTHHGSARTLARYAREEMGLNARELSEGSHRERPEEGE